MHTVEIDHQVLEAEEGLLIGNGDLSVSIYQASDQIIWRFGKNDVWDRRMDLSDCPAPAHIDEIARGVRDEGWMNEGFVDGNGQANGAVADPERMRELCDGWPAYARRPYPCPKPVGELALHLPPDQMGFDIRQRLDIERGMVSISCRWDTGVLIDLECFVAPSPNALVVSWNVQNWVDSSVTGHQVPVWFSLYRWADPTIETWSDDLFKRTRFRALQGAIGTGRTSPLPAPVLHEINGRPVIEQRFYPDPAFDEGLRYVLAPVVTGLQCVPAGTDPGREVRLHLKSDTPIIRGAVSVLIATSTDEGGAEAETSRVLRLLESDFESEVEKWRDTAVSAAMIFWKRSSVELGDSLLENVWYQTLHARRCTYRADVVAPGLMLPSTVGDYALWHGDYHTNYNYQSPFWGDATANQIALGDSFFPGMDHMLRLGRSLARDYWGCRGTFVHLTGYPFEIPADPYGSGPLSRLAYMTGWIANHYWSRYLYTQDLDWLVTYGYPVLRDCALFYLDFLKPGDDSRYHAFPSGQGESFFTGSVSDYTDRPQVVRHIRYCLDSAVQAAELLETDAELVREWHLRLQGIVDVDDMGGPSFSDEERRRYLLNPPEFISYDEGIIEVPGNPPECLDVTESNPLWRGYFGQLPWKLMIALRNRVFDADRDLEAFRSHLHRWRMPNGMFRGMAAGDYGRTGVFTECLGIIAPIQEMLLQSYDGTIRVFPAWPVGCDGSFTTLRAEQAFLVSASQEDGVVSELRVKSLAGRDCRIQIPWRLGMEVFDNQGMRIDLQYPDESTALFSTERNRTYRCEQVRSNDAPE